MKQEIKINAEPVMNYLQFKYATSPEETALFYLLPYCIIMWIVGFFCARRFWIKELTSNTMRSRDWVDVPPFIFFAPIWITAYAAFFTVFKLSKHLFGLLGKLFKYKLQKTNDAPEQIQVASFEHKFDNKEIKEAWRLGHILVSNGKLKFWHKLPKYSGLVYLSEIREKYQIQGDIIVLFGPKNIYKYKPHMDVAVRIGEIVVGEDSST